VRRRLLIIGIVAAIVAVLTAVYVVARTAGTGSDRAGPPAPTASVSVSSFSSTTTPAPGPGPQSPTRSAAPPAPSRTPGTPGVPAALRGRDVEAIPTSDRVVALTFDAGGNADGLPAILGALAARGVHATFFLTGGWAERYPAAVRSIVAAGHRLGNHSSTHPYFRRLTDEQIQAEIARGEQQVGANGGNGTRPLFRFPYGDRDARTIAAVNSAGHVAVRWTVDSLGWKGTTEGITVQQVVDRSVRAARPGEIILMHVGSHPEDGSTLDAQALPTVMTRLAALGYRFGTLDHLLR
jgi:peptidoglycan/xylan/chitin deacetylase (PgdA/CDA1 family)